MNYEHPLYGDFGYRGVVIGNSPAVNVLEHSEFTERAGIIFGILDEVLGKSCGPYGAQTIISDYPNTRATKDGFTIAMNLSFDPMGPEIDKIIARMAIDICGRINYAVGDGTTTAVMATYQMFNEIRELKRNKEFNHLPSRVFLEALHAVKDRIIEEHKNLIKTFAPNEVGDVMRKIAMVSTNSDEEISNMIADSYDKYRYPVIRCDQYDGPMTFMETIDGFPSKVRYGDKIYVNADKRAQYENVFVLMFDHQVNDKEYTSIILPMLNLMKAMGQKLMVIAPSYDDAVLYTKIRSAVLNEYKMQSSISLIIASYPMNTDSDRKAILDLALILGTTVIDKTMRAEIFAYLADVPEEGQPTPNIMDVFGWTGTAKLTALRMNGSAETWAHAPETHPGWKLNIGFATSVDMGDKESIFKSTQYDENLYNKTLECAKQELEDITKKYEILGTYTSEVYDAQRRYVALLMKTSVIHVGGDTVISRGMRMDAVEDAIRATESAFFNGYVLGANITLLTAIQNAKRHFETGVTKDKTPINIATSDAFEIAFRRVCARIYENKETLTESEIEAYIEKSVEQGAVFDIKLEEYSFDVIASAKTDEEVLAATCDLLSILLSGNQVLISRYQHPIDR